MQGLLGHGVLSREGEVKERGKKEVHLLEIENM